MYVEVKRAHPRYKDFVALVKGIDPEAKVNEYEITAYILTNARVINFFESVYHEAVTTKKGPDGDLLSFPLEMFGMIYEL